MSDLYWCTNCENAISQYSESLYCSEQCLRADALRNHPLLGYTYPEFENFPKPYDPKQLYQQKLQSLSSSYTIQFNNKKSSSIESLPLKTTSRSSSISTSSSIIKPTTNSLTPYYHSTSSSDSLNTLPSLSSSHSSCHTSPTLSAYDRLPTTTTTCSLPSFDNLPPMIPIKNKKSSVHNNNNSMNNNKNKSNIPSCLLIGATTPTTAVSRYQVFY